MTLQDNVFQQKNKLSVIFLKNYNEHNVNTVKNCVTKVKSNFPKIYVIIQKIIFFGSRKKIRENKQTKGQTNPHVKELCHQDYKLAEFSIYIHDLSFYVILKCRSFSLKHFFLTKIFIQSIYACHIWSVQTPYLTQEDDFLYLPSRHGAPRWK